MLNIDELRILQKMRSTKHYIEFTFPGMYSVLYNTQDGGILCAQCANAHFDQTCDEDDPQWYIIGYFIHWEGASVYCDHCGEECKSEYGEIED